MKAAAFEYLRPDSLDQACRLLAEAGDREYKVIAGGQTLVPLMAMRMARPDALVDINHIAGLAGISDRGDHVAVGAMTRQRAVERSDVVVARLPLLAQAIRHVGHQQTRNRGTVGGSIVHGDPAAEIPLVAVTLDASLVLRDLGGVREIGIDGFFEAAMMTGIAPDQILTEIRLPVWDHARVGAAFVETASREGDFAIVAAAAQIALAPDGAVERAAIGVGGVAAAPVRLREVEAALAGGPADAGRIEAALERLDDFISPESDVHATAAYRTRVARRLTARAVAMAAS